MKQESSQDLEYSGERLVTSIRNATMIEHLHRYAFAKNFIIGKEVLDLASGEGYGSQLLAKDAKQVTGVDISSEVVEHARKKYQRNNLRYLVGAADSVPLENNSVDVIVSFETIEHHDKHHEMLAEFKRVLRKDGILIISSPDKLNYSDLPKNTNKFHVKELYTHEFKELINEYFKEQYLFFQKVACGSLMVPEKQLNRSDFKEYSGSYQEVSKSEVMDQPLYNICVASDKEIERSLLHSSFF